MTRLPQWFLQFSLALMCLGVSSRKTCASPLFENLKVLSGVRYSVGDPSVVVTNRFGNRVRGPKEIAVADLDDDGKADLVVSDKDGSVTLRYGLGDGNFGEPKVLWTFVSAPLDFGQREISWKYTNIFCTSWTNSATNITEFTNALGTPFTVTNYVTGCAQSVEQIFTNITMLEGPEGLRGVALAKFTGSGRRDIAVAAPGEGVIHLFLNQGNRTFTSATSLPAWLGVRDLAAGDFDGDGLIDLAAGGTTNGIAQYHSLGNGTFERVANLPDAGEEFIWADFPQPAFYLKTLRQPGDSRDELLVARAQSHKLRILRAGADGKLQIQGVVTNLDITALDAAPLFTPNSTGKPDLALAFSRSGKVQLYPGLEGPNRFATTPQVEFNVPGAARNVRIADLDGDGWNDLIVVGQTYGKVFTYKNQAGKFTLQSEIVVGNFPREMDLGDFNEDGLPDLAVLNRRSEDVSILLTTTNLPSRIGFLGLDNVYPVDGEISGLALLDQNRDKRPDVMLLHRLSGEFSLRLTAPDGRLGEPKYFPIGDRPSANELVDINRDDLPDMVTADLRGFVSVRLGKVGGDFQPEQVFSLPADASSALFALVAADFNGDGHIDLAAGYLDCRVAFFEGNGSGVFKHTRTQNFIYEPRSLVVADFDQDGDIDLAGSSFGAFGVIVNPGDLLHSEIIPVVNYPLSQGGGGTQLAVVDMDQNGDPDLLVGSDLRSMIYLGGAEATFIPVPSILGNFNVGSSAMAHGDFDGNGAIDIAMVCPEGNCLNILVMTNGQYATALTVQVPVTRHIGSADLDGDGFADLIGAGDVLWVALSGRTAAKDAPAELLRPRSRDGLVINELLAVNTQWPIPQDGDRTSDWLELYNGTSNEITLQGWSVMLIRTNELPNGQLALDTNQFVLKSTAKIPSKSHQLLVCADKKRTDYHTGFNLPAEGGTLCLIRPDGTEVDRIVYPPQEPDLAYARYKDGMHSFGLNPLPTPGGPNLDNGILSPDLRFDGVTIESLGIPGRTLRFTATASDDLGIVNVSVMWRRLDVPDTTTHRLILFDDGAHEDGAMNDGKFAGDFPTILPLGAELQFYLECTDLSGAIETRPGTIQFVSPGQAPTMNTIAIGQSSMPLELSEIMPYNAGAVRDDSGGTPGWVEIRNTGSTAVSLAGVELTERGVASGTRYRFPETDTLAPGNSVLVYLDEQTDQGPYHAPFRLSRESGQLILAARTSKGGLAWVDALKYGTVPINTTLARLGVGGLWRQTVPTPRGANVVGGAIEAMRNPYDGSLHLGFTTEAGKTYHVESAPSVTSGAWTVKKTVVGTGHDASYTDQSTATRFYRVRRE